MRSKPASEPPYPGDPNASPPRPPSRPNATDLAIRAEGQRVDLDSVVDPMWRAGLHEIAVGNHVTHGRHLPEQFDIGQVATAVGRCMCTEFGGQCVLWADAEDLLCTACRIACTGGAG